MQAQTIQPKNSHGATLSTGPLAFLNRAGVAIAHHEGHVRFALAEVVAALAESNKDGHDLWEKLVTEEPELGSILEPATFVLTDGSSKIADSVDIEGVFRLRGIRYGR